ncbi:MAG: hypothetical protein ACOC55_01315 [Candidatus Natronoplasma sp.]
MRDRVLIFLTVIGFIILLTLGVSPTWSIFLLIFLIIGYMGLRYPTGRPDWSADKKETAYLVLTLVVVLLMIYLLYTVFTIVTFPSAVVILVWASAIGFAVLFLLSVIYPQGFKMGI